MNLDYQLRWQQFAHRLVDDIIQHPSTELPGIRALGKQYKVSRDTVEYALRHLEDLGIIAPAQPGRKREVDLSKLQRMTSLRGRSDNHVLFLSACPAGNPAFMTRTYYEAFHKLCEKEALFLNFIEIPSEPSELRALLSSLRPRGAILYSVPSAVSDTAFSLNIPMIGIGSSDPHVRGFFTPYAPLIIQAFQQAQTAGHRRIVTPMGHWKGSIYEGLAVKLENHFSSDPFSFKRRYNFPFVPGATPEDYHAALRELFRYTPPTCIILHDLADYLLASSFFLKEGLRIPDDISVILLSEDLSLKNTVPSIAHFALFSNDMAVQAFHALQEQMNGFQSHEKTELSAIWIPGDSLAAPKSR